MALLRDFRPHSSAVANLAPSEDLLYAARSNRVKWSEFDRRYRKELKEGSIDKRNRNINNHCQKFTLRLLQKLRRQHSFAECSLLLSALASSCWTT